MIGASIGIISLVGFLVAGVPMIAALMIAISISLMLGNQWGLVLPQNMVAGMSSYTLISFPLFVLGGIYMNAGGISGRLFNFARSLVGWMKGGLAQVDVLTSMFFGGMVGSSTADLAGTASIIIPEMKKEGYSAPFAAAVSASSAGVGPLIPPSSPAILYAAVTGTSLGALFIAGLIPGILLGLAFMAVVAYLARKHGYPTFGKFSVAEIFRTAKSAGLAFGMPGIIVGGLVLGVFTPSEAGAFGAVYAAFLALVVYRSLDLAGLYRATVAAVQLSGELLLIVSLSAALGSGQLIQALLAKDLIDEISLLIFPLVLGKGKRLFGEGAIPAAFKLTQSSVSSTGVIMATYRREGEVTTGSFALEEPSAEEIARRENLAAQG